MKNFLFLGCIALAIIAISSCSKNSHDDNAGNVSNAISSRIKTETNNSGTWTYTYDASGRITIMEKNTGNKYNYIYSPDKVVQTQSNNGNTYITNYGLNNEGLVNSETRPSDPGYFSSTIYNSEKQPVKQISTNNGNTTSYDYFYSNGNCDSIRLTNNNGNWQSTIKRTYYTDKLNYFDNAGYGQSYFGSRSKNLIKTEQYFFNNGTSNNPVTWTYEFDAAGRPVKRTSTYDANIEIVYFTY